MNLYSLPHLITSLLIFFIGLVVFSKNTKGDANKTFLSLTAVTGIWLLFAFFAYNSKNQECAELLLRISYLGIVNISIAVCHFVVAFLGINLAHVFLHALKLIGFFYGILVLFSDYLVKGVYRYEWGFYPAAGAGHPLFLTFFICLTSLCVVFLFVCFFKSRTLGVKKNQIKYVLIAFFLFNFASIDFIPNYGFDLYPFGFIPVTLFIAIIAYSVVRYRVLDVSIAITRTGIFVAVYSFVLGIPFALAFGYQEQLTRLIGENWWVAPLITSTVLGTAGPFLYLYVQRKAEDKLLQEQRRYQTTLRQASAGMSNIKDLKRLLNLIVRIVTRTVNIEYGAIYLYDPIEKKYLLSASRGTSEKNSTKVIDWKSGLAVYLLSLRESIVYEEIRQRTQDYNDPQLTRVESELRDLNAALVVPSFSEKKLLSFLVLGKKKSGKLYSPDDLAVFSILANQAALSIENSQFYEESKKTQEQLFQAEKMATIGTMADGLSHQINNRLHALGFIAGDALDTINLKKSIKMPQEAQELISEIQHSLNRIQDNVKQGGEVVQGLLKYTRKGEAGLTAVDLDELIDSAFEMAQFKVKLDQISIVRDYPKDLPKLNGNFTQLQEVFFNLIDNAYDAIMQRKTEKKEPGYRGQLRISAKKRNEKIEIGILDNGIGVKDEDQNKLFTPFFTTKTSSRKGTGLGLYVIKKLIHENHDGKVLISSEYMTGTLMTIILPAFK